MRTILANIAKAVMRTGRTASLGFRELQVAEMQSRFRPT